PRRYLGHGHRRGIRVRNRVLVRGAPAARPAAADAFRTRSTPAPDGAPALARTDDARRDRRAPALAVRRLAARPESHSPAGERRAWLRDGAGLAAGRSGARARIRALPKAAPAARKRSRARRGARLRRRAAG